jgi:hypothetical protein
VSNTLRPTTAQAGSYPLDPAQDSFVGGVIGARVANRLYMCNLNLTAIEAATADTNGVHAAVTDNGSQQIITTGFTAPPYPRNITATSGGVATDIAAIQVTVEGLNDLGEVISETLPVFTENSATTVVGNKAFASVTSWTIPAHDGVGATTELGFGDKCQLPHKLDRNTVIAAYLAKVKEGTPPTVAVSATDYHSNTVDLNSALNGNIVDVDYYL